jgi:hypothetical protein
MVMAAARQQPGMMISRAHIDAVADPATWTVDNILRATFACDYVRAAVLAFARARAGEAAPAEIIGSILPAIVTSLLGIDRRSRRLLDCVRDRMFAARWPHLAG